MKGCFVYMKKMGNFRGLPVYLVLYRSEYGELNHDAEAMYVIDNTVLYHGHRIGRLNGGTLVDFDEDRFEELRAKGWNKAQSEALGRVTGSAETRPQEEETPTYETVETADGTSPVDEFMRSWKDNIDSEIAMLQKAVSAMEDMINAVG